MYRVKQAKRGDVRWASESTDADGFSLDSWTKRPDLALVFSDRCDAEDVVAERFHRGHYLAGYVLSVEGV